MNTTQWFSDQLKASADGFVWGVKQVLDERQQTLPPRRLGDWTVARHVFHMFYYEQTIALPSMQQWLGGPCPTTDELDEESFWESRQSENVKKLLVEFTNVRAEQIALLEKFDEVIWNTTRETIWGTVTLLWVVSKTYQHTAEHASDVMRIGLFWDMFASR